MGKKFQHSLPVYEMTSWKTLETRLDSSFFFSFPSIAFYREGRAVSTCCQPMTIRVGKKQITGKIENDKSAYSFIQGIMR